MACPADIRCAQIKVDLKLVAEIDSVEDGLAFCRDVGLAVTNPAQATVAQLKAALNEHYRPRRAAASAAEAFAGGVVDDPDEVAPPWKWEKSEGEALKEVYVMIDRSLNGGITTTELHHMLLNLGENPSEKVVDEMIALVDCNGDNEIQFREFYDIMTGNKPVHDFGSFENPTPFVWEDRMKQIAEARGRRGAITPEQASMIKASHNTGDAPAAGPAASLSRWKGLDSKDVTMSAWRQQNTSVHAEKEKEKEKESPVSRKYSTAEIRQLFDSIDEDKGGTLDKDEVRIIIIIIRTTTQLP